MLRKKPICARIGRPCLFWMLPKVLTWTLFYFQILLTWIQGSPGSYLCFVFWGMGRNRVFWGINPWPRDPFVFFNRIWKPKWYWMFFSMDGYTINCVLLICCSVAQSCPTPCHPMDYSLPGSLNGSTHLNRSWFLQFLLYLTKWLDSECSFLNR